MSVAISTILYAAFRIAGVTDRPGRTPSTDQFGDALPTLNRMINSWNCDPLKIFTQAINAYPLVAAQKIYTLGGASVTGTNLSTTRPQQISGANIIYNTSSPVVRLPVRILEDYEWRSISVQDVPGTIPWSLYNDEAFPATNVYLYGQPLTTYQLELYTWQAIQTFVATTDLVVLPPGFEEAIVWNLALRVAASFPTQSNISPRAEEFARDALIVIAAENAQKPVLRCDDAFTGGGGDDYYAYKGNTW